MALDKIGSGNWGLAAFMNKVEIPQRRGRTVQEAEESLKKEEEEEEEAAAEETPASELQEKLKTSEAEIEMTKPADDESEAATGEIRAVTRAMARKARRDAAASDAAAAAAAGRHISSLGDDLVLEIFLRLPSLATLVRAAYTCRPWLRAVASSPAFRRRFRALHPPPLLGHFYDSSDHPRFPAFVPVRPHDRDLAAAVRGGDFFLTSLQDRPEESPCWRIRDCCGGNVLLVNLHAKLLAVLNPLTRQRERILDLVPEGIFERYYDFADIGIFCSDDDPRSFGVAFLTIEGSRIQATIFSSDTGVWSVTPSVDFHMKPDDDDDDNDDDNLGLLNEFCVHDSGFLYWNYMNQRYLISLDIATMKFYVVQLPRCLVHSFVLSETKDGTSCIVYSDGSNNVGVLIRMRDDDGLERWVVDRVVPMETELKRVLPDQFHEEIKLHLLEIWDGYAYLTTSAMDRHTRKPCWFLSLCLETMKLEKLFRRKFDRP
ncbi:hypothetical protein EJB05_16337, partial [Eragrostis curvula]